MTKRRVGGLIGVLGLVAGLAFGLPLWARAQSPAPAWGEQILDDFARLPIQEQGRVKPLSTWARYALLRMNHMMSFKLSEDERRGSMPWALDTLFFPGTAREYRTFLVADSEVLGAIGLPDEQRKKRDRYSYTELEPGRTSLLDQTDQILVSERDQGRKPSERTPLHRQLMMLREAMLEFESTARSVDWSRAQYSLEKRPFLASFFPAGESVRFSGVLQAADRLRDGLRRSVDTAEDLQRDQFESFLEEVVQSVSGWVGIGIFPPTASDEEEWFSARDLFFRAMGGMSVEPAHLALVQDWERLADALAEQEGTDRAFERVLSSARALATARGEYEKIDLEITYYRLDPFSWARYGYILAFVLVALTWLSDRMVWLRRAAIGLTMLSLGIHIFGIVLRCILRERPPVSTLYETVLFISAMGVLASLVIECMNGRRIALAIGPLLGGLGLMLAGGYELIDRQDTMPQLQAVLDTNFWLATHVLCITIGYAAGLLTAAFAHVYVVGKMLGFRREDPEYFTALGRMVYGTAAFTLIFSVVGTILGGIWANDSWGRFWGWDPKENGALMICLWNLVMLHARLGGYVRGFGLSMLSIVLACIVVFSWWGVNLLQVGLHSYGWLQGVGTLLTTFYSIEAAVLVAGGVWWWKQNSSARAGPEGSFRSVPESGAAGTAKAAEPSLHAELP